MLPFGLISWQNQSFCRWRSMISQGDCHQSCLTNQLFLRASQMSYFLFFPCIKETKRVWKRLALTLKLLLMPKKNYSLYMWRVSESLSSSSRRLSQPLLSWGGSRCCSSALLTCERSTRAALQILTLCIEKRKREEKLLMGINSTQATPNSKLQGGLHDSCVSPGTSNSRTGLR